MSSISRIKFGDEEGSRSVCNNARSRTRDCLRLMAHVWLVVFGLSSQVNAFTFTTSPPTVWPNGNVPMVLKLGSAGRTLIDGNTSWDTVAAQALLTDWNGYIGTIQFSASTQSPGTGSTNDHINQTFFNSTVYGQTFGGALAVTYSWRVGTTRTESDVVFNTAYSWDSYRGNMRWPSGQPLYDLRRVALHEFGHVLGLDHPDQAGQTVTALMNSIASDLDSLTADDIAGAQTLYPVQIATITTQPLTQTVIVGSTVTFSVVASGSPPPYYQWRRNGVNISGATSATYTISNVQSGQAGNYTVVVSNASGTATSTTAVLTVNVPPSITSQPQNRTVPAGNNATFSVTASGTAPLSYQWYRNNSAIAGATAASYTISAAQPSAAGDFKVQVSNVAGNIYSTNATLTVQYAPIITGQPQSQTVIVGDLVTFTISADGIPAPSYQWKRNGVNISGAAGATYTISNVQTNQAGNISVTISNAVAQTNSTTANLAVLVPFPGIYNTGLSDSRALLGDGQVDPHYKLVVNPNNPASSDSVVQNSTLFPIVSGPWIQNSSKSKWIGPALDTTGAAAGNYSYQLTVDLTGYDPRTAFLAGSWAADDTGSIFLNGADTGFRSTNYFVGFSTFTLTNGFASGTNLVEFRVSNGGSWTGLRVENLRGTAQFLTNLPLGIVTQPTGATKVITESVVFTVIASGAPPLSYQWRLNNTNIAGATADSLVLTNLQLTQAGNYSVVVTNSYGLAISSNAVLTVNPPAPCVSAPAGLVSWWPAEGDANDTASGNSGVRLNGATFAAGKVGQAFSFNGTDSYIRVADNPNLHFTNALTIEAWVYPTSHGAYHEIVSKWGILDPLQTSYTTMVTSGGQAAIGVCPDGNPANAVGLWSTNALPLNQWTHFAATYDGSALRVYINGVCENQMAYNQGIYPGTEALAIGAAGAFAGGQVLSPFAGRIDEPSVYSRALSAAEIQAIYNASSAGKCGLPPTILSSPSNQTVLAGANVTFGVAAAGTPPLSYQWRINGADIATASGASLELTNVQLSHAGNYDVIVSNNSGSVTSAIATLILGTWAHVHFDFETAETTPVWLGSTQMVQNTSASHQGTNAIAFTGGPYGGPNTAPYILTELPQGTTNVEFYFYDDYGPNPPLYQYMYFWLLEDTNSTGFAGFSMLDGGWGTTPPMTMNHYYAWGHEDYNAANMGPIRTVGWHKFTFVIGAESVAMSVDDTLVFQTNMIHTARYLELGVVTTGWGRMDDLVLTGVTVTPPTLTVSRIGNGVRVAWPVSATGFVLQEMMAPSGTWINSPANVVVEGNEYVAVISTTGTGKFFRLRK